MPVFEYTGLTEAGKNVRGIRDAESSKVLRQVLRKDGVYLTEARAAEAGAVMGEQKTGLAREVDIGAMLGFSGVSSQDLAIATRQLATLISAGIPLLIGYVRTEETFYDRPTPENLALDEAGLKLRAGKRIGSDPGRVIEAFRTAHPDASPWDLWILIATDHPRGTYSRELARRKAAQAGAPAFLYRFDWETPEGGGHMRSPHTVEIPFVFNNIKVAGPLISKAPEAFALAEKVSAAWVAFARTGNPNTSSLPKWPAYSAASRDTMLFNNTSRVEQDPDRGPRVAMEHVLKLS